MKEPIIKYAHSIKVATHRLTDSLKLKIIRHNRNDIITLVIIFFTNNAVLKQFILFELKKKCIAAGCIANTNTFRKSKINSWATDMMTLTINKLSESENELE